MKERIRAIVTVRILRECYCEEAFPHMRVWGGRHVLAKVTPGKTIIATKLTLDFLTHHHLFYCLTSYANFRGRAYLSRTLTLQTFGRCFCACAYKLLLIYRDEYSTFLSIADYPIL